MTQKEANIKEYNLILEQQKKWYEENVKPKRDSTKPTSKQLYAMKQQEEHIRPIKIAEELGYIWHCYFIGGDRFSKTNEEGEKVYTPIKDILEEYLWSQH